jgi:hypothetical protein
MSMEEIPIALNDIVRVCFTLSFKLLHYYFYTFSRDEFSFEQICSKFPIIEGVFE